MDYRAPKRRRQEAPHPTWMDAHVDRGLALGVACLIVAALVLFLGPLATAIAQSPECPEPPLPMGENAGNIESELRLQRIDDAAICEAHVDRLRTVQEKVTDLAAQGVDSAISDQEAADLLQSLIEAQVATESILATGPIRVELREQDLEPLLDSDASLAESVDTSGAASREGLWFLAGLALSLFASYVLYRQVMPRA